MTPHMHLYLLTQYGYRMKTNLKVTFRFSVLTAMDIVGGNGYNRELKPWTTTGSDCHKL